MSSSFDSKSPELVNGYMFHEPASAESIGTTDVVSSTGSCGRVTVEFILIKHFP